MSITAADSSVAERKARYRNGIGKAPDPSRSWARRVFGNPWLWACVIATPVYAYLLWHMWEMQLPTDPEYRDNPTIMAMLTEALRKSFWWALPTLGAWVLIFRFMDRWRRVSFALWYLTLGWGIAVSTFIAIYANSWAAEQMMVQGNGDPATAAGPAIFVAPFTEEFSKATILFFLAILARNRLVSRLQIISLAGLSAAGFAFTENILYYMRAFLYASTTMETGPDAEAATLELVWLRGFFTAFGHPLFTMMTALGLVVGLRAKSRTVRVVAPLAGFLSAALLHMLFNGTVTVMDEQGRMNMYYWGALPMVGFAILTVILASFEQGRLIRSRLTDYVRMGWLQFQDPVSTGRQWLRFKANLAAWLMGWTAIVSTLKLQRRLTELAYLRDAMTRGLIDRHGATREEELLGEIRALRPTAIDDPARTRLRWGWTGRRKRADFAPPTTYPGPAGIGGNWPAPGSSVQMDAPPARSAPPQQFPPPSGRPFGS